MQTKYLFSFIFFGITFTSMGQKVNMALPKVQKVSAKQNMYSLQQFMGKWQEIYRIDRKGNSVSFKDTLFYYFSQDNKVFSRDGVNMSLKGEASVQPDNVLEAAADVFTIKSLDNNRAVLDDGEQYIHTLIKKKIFWYENLPTDSIVAEKFTTPIKPDIAAIRGNWMVYRRDAKPGSTSNGELLIKTLNIGNNKTGDTMNGEVTFYEENKSETEPCTITLNGEIIYIVSSKHHWHMNVYKANGNEFVFGYPSLLYYCKSM